MNHYAGALVLVMGLSLSHLLQAQAPGTPQRPTTNRRDQATAESFIARMMTFDRDKNGQVHRDECTDQRLEALFTRADEDKNDSVTKEELLKLHKVESATIKPSIFGGFGPPRGRGPRAVEQPPR